MSECIVLLKDGRLVYISRTEDFYLRPANLFVASSS